MECPQLNERLWSLAVVARRHAPSCAWVAMHYRCEVSLCIVAISFIPPTQFHARFVHVQCISMGQVHSTST